MVKKLHNQFNGNTISKHRKSHWPTSLLILLLCLGTVPKLLVANNGSKYLSIEDSQTKSAINDPAEIVKSYAIHDSSTEDKSCFPTKGVGVIYQRAAGCQGSHHIWSVYESLTLNEYSDDTAKITGSVIDQNGSIGIVDIELTEKAYTGNTWNAQCYLDGILNDSKSFYRSFNGVITVDGEVLTVERKASEQHYILGTGAGFEPGQYGFGAWTAGSFGGCTEWFGNLEAIPVPCDVTADAGIDVSINFGESTTLTATGGGSYIWSTGETTASITVAPNETTTYSVMVTSNIGECTDADQVLVTVDCAMVVDLGEDLDLCEETETVLTANITNVPRYSKVIASYNVTDADTTTGICENVHGNEQGVILQKGNPDFPVTGRYNAWKVHEGLVLNEYENQTARITGSVIDEQGKIGIVDVLLFDKQSQGTSWKADCYLEGLVGPQVFYQSFHGTIIVDGQIYTVEPKKSGHHFVFAEGASLETGQFGFGAWTAGTFGNGGEWFGNLEPIEIENCETVSYLWSTGETTESITVSESGEYTVTVKTCKDCEATDTVKVAINSATADAGDDASICIGDTATLTVAGEGAYLWSNGETTQSIEVSPEATTTYTVTVTNGQCEASDEVTVTVDDKVMIGDYVWLDENRNGLQDENATGINGVSVKLYQCAMDNNPSGLVDSTETTDGPDGAGYYQFDVCPNSGEYYIVFGDIPEELEFTEANTGDISNDSNANMNGRTNCFVVAEDDNPSIDAGLTEICDLNVDAGEAKEICADPDSTVELTATIEDGTDDCEGGCVYPVLEQERCFGPTGTFEIWLNSSGGLSSWAFQASEQRFERLANGNAKYTATASNGVDTIVMDVTFSGYTTTPVMGSPKLNDCQDYDTSDWEYWTTWTGTIVSENHGTYTMSMMGAPFQMGVGADVTRSGFGASGWFSTEGGDGYYTIGDVNIPLAECQENGIEYQWTTKDGNIVSDPFKKTISVDQPGTYIFEAMNCIDCFSTDTVVVSEISCAISSLAKTSKISKVYPIPVASGGTLTLEFGIESDNSTSDKAFGPQLKEDVSIVVYDFNGRIVSAPRSFEMIDGKAVIYLDVDNMPSGKYFVKAQGSNWSESKQILVR